MKMIAEISAASYAVSAACLPRGVVNLRPSSLLSRRSVGAWLSDGTIPRSASHAPSRWHASHLLRRPSASCDLMVAASPCLDPTDTAYSCDVDGDGYL